MGGRASGRATGNATSFGDAGAPERALLLALRGCGESWMRRGGERGGVERLGSADAAKYDIGQGLKYEVYDDEEAGGAEDELRA